MYYFQSKEWFSCEKSTMWAAKRTFFLFFIKDAAQSISAIAFPWWWDHNPSHWNLVWDFPPTHVYSAHQWDNVASSKYLFSANFMIVRESRSILSKKKMSLQIPWAFKESFWRWKWQRMCIVLWVRHEYNRITKQNSVLSVCLIKSR